MKQLEVPLATPEQSTDVGPREEVEKMKQLKLDHGEATSASACSSAVLSLMMLKPCLKTPSRHRTAGALRVTILISC